MFKKLFGESKMDKLEARFAVMEAEKVVAEAEKVEAAAENARLAAELKAIQEAKSPKELATEADEPWVDVIETTFEDPDNPATGYFELDWNKQFVNQLIEKGYSGRTDDDVIDQWFNDLCRGVIGDNI
jgi:ABC-type metal ion transport system substrate-binding protein